jgi:hypothetical protein
VDVKCPFSLLFSMSSILGFGSKLVFLPLTRARSRGGERAMHIPALGEYLEMIKHDNLPQRMQFLEREKMRYGLSGG